MKLSDIFKTWTIVKVKEYDSLKLDIANLQLAFNNQKALIQELEQQIIDCNKELEKYKPSELETYWNNKLNKVDRSHPARDGVKVDVRVFWQKDYKLPTFKGTNDEKAEQALAWCVRNLVYTSDSNGEFWQYAYETLLTRTGDCEDGAILMANMMIMSGIPYWRIRLNAGDVKGGGHAWVTYLREEDNEWYVMDWCYWPQESLGYRKKWKDAEKYFKIWYSWNKEYTFYDLPKNT